MSFILYLSYLLTTSLTCPSDVIGSPNFRSLDGDKENLIYRVD